MFKLKFQKEAGLIIKKTYMKKVLILIAILFAFALSKQTVYASVSKTDSAKLVAMAPKVSTKPDYRVKALQNIFKKYNSPLVDYAPLYVKYADKYSVDWKLLPSISGLESSFGQFLMPGSYNGYGWGGGYIYFKDWEDGIDTINKTIRTNYMNKWGATDVWSIGPIYAESKTWSVRVNGFMNEIEAEYLKLASPTLLVTI